MLINLYKRDDRHVCVVIALHRLVCSEQRKGPPVRAFLLGATGLNSKAYFATRYKRGKDGSRKEKSLQKQAFKEWLGYEDSNLGMVESESTALPLGDTPTNVGAELSVKGRNKEPLTCAFSFLPTASSKWLGCRDSNPGWRNQNPLPYRLATPQETLAKFTSRIPH